MRRNMFTIALALTAVTCLTVGATDLTFTDMPQDYSTTSLEAAVQNGLLSGSDNLLRPDDNLSRAEMASILSRAFQATQGDYSTQFQDVSSDDWFYDEIAIAVEMGIFYGSGDSMNPNDPITRQDAFLVLSRAFQITQGDTSVLDQFSDGDQIADYAKDGLAALIGAELVMGSDGEINPTDSISRKDFAVMMNRLVQTYMGEGDSLSDATVESLMVQGGDVVLDNVIVTGDLYIGDGVGDGTVTLNNVTVTGRVVVRGGESVLISGDSLMDTIIVVDGDESVIQTETASSTTAISSGSSSSSSGSDDEEDSSDEQEDEPTDTSGASESESLFIG